jgi:hypothetical protein
VPLALGAIPLAFARIAEAKGPGGRVDLPGLVLVTVAALGLAWGLVRGNAAGWGSAETVTAFCAGAAATVGFVAWERRAVAAMLPVRLFRSPAFSAGNAAIFLLNASLSGAVFLMPQFEQVVDGQDLLTAGLRLLPWGIAPFLVAPRAGALADRLGERALALAGLSLQTAGLAWLAAVAWTGVGYVAIIAPMSVIGIGFGLAVPAVTRAVTSNVPPQDIGRASGAYSMMRQLGGAFGVAILGAAFSAAGSYASASAFATGFRAAFAAGAGIALAGVAAAAILPGRHLSVQSGLGAPSSGQERTTAAPNETIHGGTI